jgi:16S rRNA (guanine966-N2)-methyltransferase
MRIIAGSLSGRIFDSPSGHKTHPMSDKVRGGLFNVLGDIEGLTVLDAFAGSGALGFEALSRGARQVTAIDSDKSAQRTIETNARILALTDRFKLIKASANGWLTTGGSEKRFDLVLCDPPYNDLQQSLVTRLSQLVAPKGTLVLSWPGNETAPAFVGMEIALEKNYGDAQLVFYKQAT